MFSVLVGRVTLLEWCLSHGQLSFRHGSCSLSMLVFLSTHGSFNAYRCGQLCFLFFARGYRHSFGMVFSHGHISFEYNCLYSGSTRACNHGQLVVTHHRCGSESLLPRGCSYPAPGLTTWVSGATLQRWEAMWATLRFIGGKRSSHGLRFVTYISKYLT